MSLTLDDIDAAENGVKRVRVILGEIGREFYKMREGISLGSEYAFDRYARTNYAGEHFDGQEGPDWGVGTPIFSLRYYWSRACDERCVTFPQGWLERDWRTLESERLTRERDAKAALERKEARRAARESAAAERETYQRLKSKFEPANPTRDEGNLG